MVAPIPYSDLRWKLKLSVEFIIPWPTDYRNARVILAWEAEYEQGIRMIVKNGTSLSLD